MAEMLSPGVYVSEMDYSEYVSETSTCIVGMVGGARRGPVGVPTLVTSQEQLISTFGKPSLDDYGIYSALAALTKVSQLYYTRVVRGGIKASAGDLGSDKVLYSAKEYGEDSNGIQVEQTDLSDEKFSVTVKSSTGETLETYSDLSLSGTVEGYVESVINAQSNYIQASVQFSGSLRAKTFTLDGGSGSGTYARAGVEGSDKIAFRSKYYDSDINGCMVTISEQDDFGYFDVTLKGSSGVIESWTSLSLDSESDRYIESIINTASGRIIAIVNSNDEVEFTADTLSFSGGDDGIHGISVADIIGEETGTGLYSFSNPETVDIDLLAAPGCTSVDVISTGIHICEERGDCIYIADTPFGMNAQEVIAWSNGTGSYNHKGFDSSYGAMYWPWVKISDSYSKKNIWLPPSGYVIAQYAYNDDVAHPWNAPAGLERGAMSKPIGLELSPTKGERDAVYGNRNIINPLANFLSNGIVIWGQKTMQRKPSALDRVNVRRLMTYLKKTIGLSTKYFVFEQNTESTWERWRNMVEPILSDIKANGGIYEYKIEVNPSAADIENNHMPVKVYIKPTKTSEFIPIEFNIMPYSASFD